MMLVLHIFTVTHMIRVLERGKKNNPLMTTLMQQNNEDANNDPSFLKNHVDGAERVRVLNMLQHMEELELGGCCYKMKLVNSTTTVGPDPGTR
jgi:hypothetical protein